MIANIEYLSELLNRLVKEIKPKQKYDDIILRIAEETKKDITEKYHCSEQDIYGVFGKDDFFVVSNKKEKGKKLIARIAQALCKNMGKVVITGNTIYHNKKGKVNRETAVLDNMKQKLIKDALWRVTFSKCMGHIPHKGIFLIDDKRSGSIHEEGTFHIDDTKKGLAVIIPPKSFKPCKYMIEIRTAGKLKFHKCISSDFKKCCESKSRCIAKKMKINKSTTEPFIQKETHSVILTRDLSRIEKVIIEAFKT